MMSRGIGTVFKTICMLVFIAAAPSSFAIFKCVDEATGGITFTDTACPNYTPGDYHPIGSTNSDSDSASLNAAGTAAIRDGIRDSENRKPATTEQGRTSSQPRSATTEKKSMKDKYWFERRMCQKRRNCDGCCYDIFPLP